MSVRPGGPEQRGTVVEHGAVQCRYPLHPTSVRLARHLVRLVCRRWRALDAGDAAALTVSELVSNSVKAGAGDEVTLRLSWTPRRLRVEVHDASSDAPVLREPGPSAEGGRGMWLISQFAVRWGVDPLRPRGKCVWAEIALPVAA